MVVRSLCQENCPAYAHPSAHKSVLESPTQAWTQSVHLDAPCQRHGQQPVSGTADPAVIKQNKSSKASIDTTKTRAGPERVRRSSGERQQAPQKANNQIQRPCATSPPLQHTMASCQTPLPLPVDPSSLPVARTLKGGGGGPGKGAPTTPRPRKPTFRCPDSAEYPTLSNQSHFQDPAVFKARHQQSPVSLPSRLAPG